MNRYYQSLVKIQTALIALRDLFFLLLLSYHLLVVFQSRSGVERRGGGRNHAIVNHRARTAERKGHGLVVEHRGANLIVASDNLDAENLRPSLASARNDAPIHRKLRTCAVANHQNRTPLATALRLDIDDEVYTRNQRTPRRCANLDELAEGVAAENRSELGGEGFGGLHHGVGFCFLFFESLCRELLELFYRVLRVFQTPFWLTLRR